MKNNPTPWPPNRYLPLKYSVQNVNDMYIKGSYKDFTSFTNLRDLKEIIHRVLIAERIYRNLK